MELVLANVFTFSLFTLNNQNNHVLIYKTSEILYENFTYPIVLAEVENNANISKSFFESA